MSDNDSFVWFVRCCLLRFSDSLLSLFSFFLVVSYTRWTIMADAPPPPLQIPTPPNSSSVRFRVWSSVTRIRAPEQLKMIPGRKRERETEQDEPQSTSLGRRRRNEEHEEHTQSDGRGRLRHPAHSPSQDPNSEAMHITSMMMKKKRKEMKKQSPNHQ